MMKSHDFEEAQRFKTARINILCVTFMHQLVQKGPIECFSNYNIFLKYLNLRQFFATI